VSPWQLSNRLAVPVRVLGRRVKELLSRPILPYVELHLTDHCNLDCRGCFHFSPLADVWYADVSSHEHDMRRLSRLFKNVDCIRLMGGEPLLHPQVSSFFTVTRRHFPDADIRVVTNGLLLSRMEPAFWWSCKTHRIRIDMTLYPIALDTERLRRLADSHQVQLRIVEVTEFHAGTNLRGDSEPGRAMRHCRAHNYCPFLKEGRIYPCVRPAVSGYFNRAFNTCIPTSGYLDIHERTVTGWKILEFLEKPCEACRYCRYEYRYFPWGRSTKQLEEWCIADDGLRESGQVSCDDPGFPQSL